MQTFGLWIVTMMPGVFRWAIVGAVVGGVSSFFWSWDARGKKIERQKHQIAKLEQDIKIGKSNIVLREAEIKVLDDRFIRTKEDLINSCTALWRSAEGPDEDAIDSILEAIEDMEDNKE